MSSNISRNIEDVNSKLAVVRQIAEAEDGGAKKGFRLVRSRASASGNVVTKRYNGLQALWKLGFKGGKYQTFAKGKEDAIRALNRSVHSITTDSRELSREALNAPLNGTRLEELKRAHTLFSNTLQTMDAADRMLLGRRDQGSELGLLAHNVEVLRHNLRDLETYIEMRALEIRDDPEVASSGSNQVLAAAALSFNELSSLERNGIGRDNNEETRQSFTTKLNGIRNQIEERVVTRFSDALERELRPSIDNEGMAFGDLRGLLESLDGQLTSIQANKHYPTGLKERLGEILQAKKLEVEDKIETAFTKRLDEEWAEVKYLEDTPKFKEDLDARLRRIETSTVYSPELKAKLKQQVFEKYVKVAIQLISHTETSLKEQPQGNTLQDVIINLSTSHALIRDIFSQLDQLKDCKVSVKSLGATTETPQKSVEELKTYMKNYFNSLVDVEMRQVGEEIEALQSIFTSPVVADTPTGSIQAKSFETIKEELTSALAGAPKTPEFDAIKSLVEESRNVGSLAGELRAKVRALEPAKKALNVLMKAKNADPKVQILPKQEQEYACISALEKASKDLWEIQKVAVQRSNAESLRIALDTTQAAINQWEENRKRLEALKL